MNIKIPKDKMDQCDISEEEKQNKNLKYVRRELPTIGMVPDKDQYTPTYKIKMTEEVLDNLINRKLKLHFGKNESQQAIEAIKGLREGLQIKNQLIHFLNH